MTNYLAAMAAALAMRNACQRQVDKSRPIEHISIGALVRQAARDAAARLQCDDDVFEGMARALQLQSGSAAGEAFEGVFRLLDPRVEPGYTRWRHGGWYVGAVRYPSGACGCVSRNYPDRKWRIVCDERRRALNEPGDVTFRSRDEAARAEQVLALACWVAAIRAAK